MKVVAVIPVLGRLPLLKHTIERLLKVNGVHEVVCVAELPNEEKLIKECGAHFVKHVNSPLGKKWNAGFRYAQKLKPDAILFVGSSDWLSDNWLSLSLPYMKEYDLVGKSDFYMIDIADEVRACHWIGYGKGDRETEPIGIGRLISARVLDKLNWKPFDDDKKHNMDHMMFQKVGQLDGAIGLIQCDEMKALSISTNRWDNLHKFEQHWNDTVPSKSIRLNAENLIKEFPQVNLIFE
jgi:glycosyltransferase involved in cell wall biosynthesis